MDNNMQNSKQKLYFNYKFPEYWIEIKKSALKMFYRI